MQTARLSLFLIVFLFSNCAPKTIKKTFDGADKIQDISSENTILEDTLSSNTLILPEQIVNKLILKYTTTGCYGKCPVFEVKFYENSNYALWQGYSHTDKLGLYEAEIDFDLLSEIQKRANQNNFHSLLPFYPEIGNFLEDYPATSIYVREGEKETLIKFIYDAPVSLTTFDDFLVGLYNNLDWVKVNEGD